MVVNNRIWVVGAAIIMVAILALGYFLGVAPRLAEVTANEEQRQSVATQNQAYEAALAGLKKDFAKLDEYKDELAALQKQLPPGADLSTFIGSLRQLEAASGVTLTNFGAADAAPFTYVPPIPPAVAAPVEAPAEGDAAATDAPVVEAPPVPVDPSILVQTLAPEEFIYIDVSLTVTGTQQSQVLDFVEALQKGDRRYLVTTLSIDTDTSGAFVGTITGFVYVLIDPSKPAVLDENVSLENTPATATTTP